MAQDYIQRNHQEQRQTPPPRAKRWHIVLLIIAVVVLISLLWVPRQDPAKRADPTGDAEPQIITAALPAPASFTAADPPSIAPPPIPEEKWQFVENLPSQAVKVRPAAELAKQPSLLQCGAYPQKVLAQARQQAIEKQGLTSHLKKNAGSRYYRVLLGPYESKRAAEKDMHILQRAKIEPCLIFPWHQLN